MKIILNAAIMDLCHRGHLNLLRGMRQMGDRVIVVLHDDQSAFDIKDKFPIQDIKKRVKNVKMTRLVDKVLVCKSIDPGPMFEKIILRYGAWNIVYVRGDDMTKGFPGQYMLEKYGVPIVFLPYTNGVSSSQLREYLLDQEL